MVNTASFPSIGMTSQRTRERLIRRLRASGISDERVLMVMQEIPRHAFIDEALEHRSYEDTALPIGLGQTISQPYIVARMTSEVLGDTGIKSVLEIGTGSGYQAAILSRLVDTVYSLERLSELLNQARKRFRLLGLKNIVLKHEDGAKGWPEHAPFEGIIVTAAAAEVPTTLLEQLAVGGRMVIPVGASSVQELQLITRTDEGFETQVLDMVRFVPFLSGED